MPENDDFAYQDDHPDDPQGDDPDEYDPNWADDDDPVEVAGQADMFAHEDFWNASADDSEALPEEEKVYKHSIFKPEMKKPNFVLSMEKGTRCWITVRVEVDANKPEYPSVTPRVPAAVWASVKCAICTV